MIRFAGVFRALGILVLLAVLVVAFGVGGVYWYLTPKLPSAEILRDVRLQVPLRVYTRDRKLIAEFGEKRRTPLRLDQVPERLIQAFLAGEDDRFFEHPGVDWQGLTRAALHLIRTGEKGPGGSTITMQVARNFFLSREKTYIRKLNEILLALKIEREITKDEILELYVNKIFLGQRAYGVGAAAQVYYGRPIEELTLAQLAMIRRSAEGAVPVQPDHRSGAGGGTPQLRAPAHARSRVHREGRARRGTGRTGDRADPWARDRG